MFFKVKFFSYLFLYGVVSLVLFHLPLLTYVFNNVNYQSVGGGILVLSVLFVYFCGNFILLTLLSLLHTKVMKFFTLLFFLCNAIAAYFLFSYNIMFDKAMMGNVFNTNTSEASELFSYKIVVYVVVLGVVPALLFSRIKIVPTSIIAKLKVFAFSAVFIAVWGFANSSHLLWFDKHAKYLGAMVLPYSYTINSIRYYKSIQKQAPPLPLSNLVFNDHKETLVVLVIGEAARRANFSLYGYKKNTNPLLSQQKSLLSLTATSCNTYTTASIECMLTAQGSEGGATRYENLPTYLHRFGVKVLWRSVNWGEGDSVTDVYQRREDIQKLCTEHCDNLVFDEVLLYDLEQQIAQLKGTKTFVVLHQSGSHGPTYYKKYPHAFEKFTPVCQSVELQNCSYDELVNAYDNTIVYNDYFLNSLIELLKKQEKRVVLLYISDHGESLGEDGFYLHGMPKQIAPAYQYEVPFLVWTNDAFQKEMALKPLRQEYNQDFIFHSVLGAFGGTSKEYKENFDLFEKKQ